MSIRIKSDEEGTACGTPQPTSRTPRIAKAAVRIFEKIFLVFSIVFILMLIARAFEYSSPEETLYQSALLTQGLAQSVFWWFVLRKAGGVLEGLPWSKPEDLEGLARAVRSLAIALLVIFTIGLALSVGVFLLARTPIRFLDISMQLAALPAPSSWAAAVGATPNELEGVLTINLSAPLFAALLWLFSYPIKQAACMKREESRIL